MRTLVCLIILLLTVQAGNAILPNKFHFRHYNIENGISSNGISSIIQDRKGYIWIGTDNGISRFDGTQFVFYQKKNPRYQNLQGNSINTICEINDKEIWIGTENGVYIYNQEEDKFTPFNIETEEGVSISS